jgi:hypothetical protein
MVVEGVPPGERFFALRSFDAERNRGPMSNLARAAQPSSP